jgi:hypothetical protein
MFDVGWRPKLYNKISTRETSSSNGAIVYTAGGGGRGLSLAHYLTSTVSITRSNVIKIKDYNYLNSNLKLRLTMWE